ncbi:hypothetical protein ACQ86N_37475 [Puia sp. P3]|uniref:hypothetical protein n=1 Tax=Puia sp. P3 TaxID=3423952 RepID=UPI003D6644FF
MKPLNFILWLAWAMLPFAVHSQDTLTAIDLNQNLGNGWPPVPTVGNEPYFHWYGTGNQINDTYLNRGTGMVVGATLAGGFVGSGFTDHSLAEAIANNRYYEFSTTPAYGVITIMALDCYLYRSTNGPVWYQWMISSDDFTTTSVPLGDSVLFTGFDSAGIQQPEINTRLTSGFQYLASGKYYRLYAWGGSDTAGVFGFGRPPHSSSITTLGRGADHYQSYAVGASWGWSVPGFLRRRGIPVPRSKSG